MEREELIESLETIRMQRLCCYTTPDRCDCKYIENKELKQDRFANGEQTGCCEMREAIGILRIMSDEEYNRMKKRQVKKVNEAFKKLKDEGKWLLD